MSDKNYCLILAGGNGSRLWPVSRTSKPKQFLDLLGTGRTMLQQTYDRISRFIPPDHIYISTIEQYLPIIHEQLPEVDDMNILEEPLRRGTLPAVTWGAVVIERINPQGCLFVTPADQLIQREAEYQEDVLNALEFVSKHEALLVTGIPPTRPETGYGYIQIDPARRIDENICHVQTFTEKPNAEFAQMFLDEGDFLWNSGLLYFNVEVMLRNLCTLVPEYQVELSRMRSEAETSCPLCAPEFFSTLPNLNVDVSFLERSEHVYVQCGRFGWTDLGTWATLYDDTPHDAEGNVLLNSKALFYDSYNNIVRLPDERIAVIKGLKDYVVAEEGEILMICPREDAAAMRRMHTDTKFS